MKRLVFFFALIALFAVNKVSAATDDVITGYVTCVEKDGSRHSVEMMFQITSENLKRVRIWGYYNASGKYNSLSLYPRSDYFDGCEIIVPEKIGQYTVVAVGKYSFCKCMGKVTLPESVTDIEDHAFDTYTYNGHEFQLPSKVRYIGKGAFTFSDLPSITLNANLKNIGDSAFFWSTNLSELVIPKSVSVIGKCITGGCGYLKRLEVESGCNNYYTPEGSNVIMEKELGASGQPSKTIIAGCRTSRIPDDTYRIGPQAFTRINFDIRTLTIPESVGVIGSSAFRDTNIKHLIIKGQNVEIKYNAFYYCTDLERIDLYGGNVTLDNLAFAHLWALEELWCYDHKPKLTDSRGNQFAGSGINWELDEPAAVIYAKYPNEYVDYWVSIFGDTTDKNLWTEWFKEIRSIDEGSKVIREVNITDFNWPEVSKAADYTATSLTKGATVSEIGYLRESTVYHDDDYTWVSPTEFTEDDRLYLYAVTFDVYPTEGYTLSDNVDLYVDDQKASYYTYVEKGGVKGVRFIVEGVFVALPSGGIPIKEAYVNVPQPVKGQPLSTEILAPTSGVKYVVDNVAWAGPNLESYDPTQGYTLAAILTAKENYCFGADCNFTLNGKTASVIRSHTAEGRERVMLAVAYGNEEPEPDPTYINTLTLTVAEPVGGEVPVAEVLSPTSEEMEAMGYTISEIYWRPADKPFSKNEPIELIVVLNTNDYTLFAPDGAYYVNGHRLTGDNDKACCVVNNNDVSGKMTIAYTYPQKEIYTVFEESTGTLTYYYDLQRSEREGVTELYDPVNDPDAARFTGYNKKVLKAVIDKSMYFARLTSTYSMFFGGINEEPFAILTLPNMTEIQGLENLHTGNVTRMDYMFEGCNALQTVDVRSFDVSRVSNMDFMFGDCYKLTTIYCNKDWSTGTTISNNMFANCKELVGGEGTPWSSSAIDKTYARPDGGTGAAGYFTFVVIKGDVNRDSKVNTADVVAVYSYIEKGDASGFSREAADVNNDGSVNTADVVAIYSIIIKGDVE